MLIALIFSLLAFFFCWNCPLFVLLRHDYTYYYMSTMIKILCRLARIGMDWIGLAPWDTITATINRYANNQSMSNGMSRPPSPHKWDVTRLHHLATSRQYHLRFFSLQILQTTNGSSSTRNGLQCPGIALFACRMAWACPGNGFCRMVWPARNRHLPNRCPYPFAICSSPGSSILPHRSLFLTQTFHHWNKAFGIVNETWDSQKTLQPLCQCSTPSRRCWRYRSCVDHPQWRNRAKCAWLYCQPLCWFVTLNRSNSTRHN